MDSRVTDISNSPAFTFLDDLFQQGKLTRAQVDEFKQNYQKLHEVVIQAYKNEKFLLDKAKEMKSKLETEKTKFTRKAVIQRETQAELEILDKAAKASEHIVKDYQKELAQVDFELEQLEQEKAEREQALADKHEQTLLEMDPEIESIETDIKSLKDGIKRMQENIEKENSVLVEKQRAIEEQQRQHSLNEKENHRLRAELTKFKEEPERIRKNISRYEGVRKDLEEQSNQLHEEIKRLDADAADLNEECEIANGEIEELGFKLENFRMAIAKRNSNIEDIKREKDTEIFRADEMEQKHAEVRMVVRELKDELRNQLEETSMHHKECDKKKKQYERLRRKRDTVMSILPPLKAQYEMAKAQLKELDYQYDLQKKMLAEIKEDEELFISQYLAQEKLEEDTSHMLSKLQEDRHNLEEQIVSLDKQERKLQQTISKLSSQRELMAREASRATGQYRETKEDLKVKNLILMDLDKQTHETKGRLQGCSLKYEKMKNQRNRLANLTQSSSQALAEMKEKIKILLNEVEILRNESLARDRALTEEIRIHQSTQNKLDASRVEFNKYQNILRQKKIEQSQQLMEIEKLNSIVNHAEAQMMQLRKEYAQSVDARNLTGIQLIDRNDELCILYEKSNIHQSIFKQGDEVMKGKEDELRVIKNDQAEMRRKIEVARKNIPSLSVYASTTRTLEAVEQQLEQERALTRELCAKLENPTGTDGEASDEKLPETKLSKANQAQLEKVGGGYIRCRKLKGMDPEPEQLATKIEVLEERLNDKKEQLLEKELVLDEVTSLSDKLRMQAAERRHGTLDIAKKVNEYQAKIRAITRKMMAAVSELSMYQATAMKLERQKQEQEKKRDEAHSNASQGLPPSAEAEHEWYRMERDRIRRAEALIERKNHAQELENRPPGLIIQSTAEPRPNAYIPEELGLPKPYGALAPFKPTIMGTNMRHIRKPVPQDVQL